MVALSLNCIWVVTVRARGLTVFITTQVTSWLDGKHVVFGEVVEGMDVVKAVEAIGTDSGAPRRKVVITSSGVV
jgi:peptidylprolyl isomerase